MAPSRRPTGAPGSRLEAAGSSGSGTHAADAPADPPGFEQALERLEAIVEELEAGSLSLEESLARYEEGVRLSRRLTGTLDQAEKRIERLVEEGGEAPTTRPLELEPRSNEKQSNEDELPF